MNPTRRSAAGFGKRVTSSLSPFATGASAPASVHPSNVCSAAPVTTETIESVERLQSLRDSWNELLRSSRADNLFLTWEWVYTWWGTLAEKRQLRIVAVRRGSRLIGLAPLALRPAQPGRLQPFRCLEFAGMGIVGTDYLDFIVRRDEEAPALDALAAHLAGQKFMLELKRVKADSMVASGLASRLDHHGWRTATTISEFCPYVRLRDHSWESYLASLGSSHRQNLRRRLRHIEKKHTPVLQEVETEIVRRKCLKRLMILHHKRWDRRRGSEAFNGEGIWRFHEEFSRLSLQRGWLRLFVLWLDNRPAAAIYGFRYGDVFYYYQAGFDPEFGRYSVGLVILGLSIRKAIAGGVREYDFLHGVERYKFLWTRSRRPLLTLRCYPPGPSGSVPRQLKRLRGKIKTLAYRSVAASNRNTGPLRGKQSL